MSDSPNYDAKVEQLASMSFEDMEKEFPTLWSLEGHWAWIVYDAMKKKLERYSRALNVG
jgi:hypothetical protein